MNSYNAKSEYFTRLIPTISSSVVDPNPRGSKLFFAESESKMFVPDLDSDPVPDPVI
jgi:hypothetical protein